MKHIIRCSLLFFCIGINSVLFAQVHTYTSLKKIEQSGYNFLDSPVTKNKLDKDKNIKIVYSDRAKNNVYLDPYSLKKGKQQHFLTPYYVINEKNNLFEIVKLDPSLLGKPKGLLSPVYSGKYTFKKAKNVSYVGWIQKHKLLLFSHPKISEYNFRPLRYLLGINKLDALFNIKKHVAQDLVHVYDSPKLKNKIDKKFKLGQFVYLYKYSDTKASALVSNLKNMYDTVATKQIMGWIPASMLKNIGQQQVLDIHKMDSLFFTGTNKTEKIGIEKREIASDFLYINKKHRQRVINNYDSLNVSVPLHVWDNYDSKLINVEGNDILIRKIKEIKDDNKIINFHYIFDCSLNTRPKQKKIVSSLQRIWMQISEDEMYKDYEFNFTASSYGCSRFYNFPMSKSFQLWIDYIRKAIADNPSITSSDGGKGIAQCLEYSLAAIKTPSFSNNIIMIVGEKKFNNIHDFEQLTKKIALSSSRLIFYQLENKSTPEYQDYMLQAKQILSLVGSKYAAFLKAYTVENKLVKKNHIFINIPSKDNIYVYDSPENSIYQGGLVFPKINQQLDPASFDIALDAVLSKTIKFNKIFINSLEYHAGKLGFLGAKSGFRIHQIIENDTLFNKRIIPKYDLKSNYYENRSFNFSENSGFVQGFLLSESELEILIDGYRSLSPKITEALSRKDRNVIFKLYKDNLEGINTMILRKELGLNSSLAELFFFKTGFPVQIKCFNDISVSDLRSKRRVSNKLFFSVMNYVRGKTEELENLLEQGNGIELKGEKGSYYFIPIEKII